MAKYTFTAARFGRDITKTAGSFKELRAILEYWLVWDEGGDLMRCHPERVTRDNGQSVDSRFLYGISHGRESYSGLRRALRTQKGR